MENETSAEVIPPHAMLDLFEDINISAPMVRYSKLPFRHLVSLYSTHITYTPMILAQEFSRSEIGRRSDFTTSAYERGTFFLKEKGSGTLARHRQVRGSLIAQFAASDPKILADASELIYPHVDGIDLNLGCPQKWAYQEHIGSYLLRQPDQVRDLVRAARDRTGWAFPISVKIRIDPDLKRTQQLVETAINVGASHISVHGRNRHQPSTVPVDLSGIRFAVECAKGRVPVVANGDAWSAVESVSIRKQTGVQGVMSARGLLANPALFAGYERTPMEAVSNFVHLCTEYSLQFPLFHRHLAFMLEERFTRAERGYFNSLSSFAGVIDYLESKGVELCPSIDVWSYSKPNEDMDF